MAVNTISKVAGVTLSGSTNNEVATVTGGNSLTGESNLTFDGTDLIVTGNVGINESAPDTPLHVNGTYSSTEGGLKLQSNNNDAAKMTFWNKDTSPNADSRRWGLANNQSAFGDFQIQRGTSSTGDPTTAVMTFDKDGNVGIGKTPTYSFEVELSNDAWVANFKNSNATQGHGLQLLFAHSLDNNTYRFISASDASADRFKVDCDGDVYNHDGTYGTISDRKLKQDIVDVRSYWDDFKLLQYRKYRHISDVEENPDAPYRLGLIADEVGAIFPSLAPFSPDLDDEGLPTGEQTQVVRSSIIEGPIMASVVQELMARVETLEAQLAALQGA